MKAQCIFFLLFFFALSLQAQEPRANSFEGKVKSVEEHSFKARKRKKTIVKGRPFREFSWEKDFRVEYDSSGRELSIISYERDGDVFRKRSFFYDVNGFGTKIILSDGNNRKLDSSVFANHYFPDGRIRKRYAWYQFPSEAQELVYKYDSTGTIHEYIREADDSYEHLREVANYSANWLKKEEYTYSTVTNKITVITRYEYNQASRPVLKEICNSSGGVLSSYHWKYGENEQLIRYEVCNEIRSNCAHWTYKYEFDTKGNWTRCVEYRNGKPVFVKERTISYWN